MSNSMDTGGTNRIVKQRHEEWFAERQRDRQSKLLEPPPGESGPGILASIRQGVGSLARRIAPARAPIAPLQTSVSSDAPETLAGIP